MPKKDERPTAKHTLEYLEQNKGTGIRFGKIYSTLRERGYHHNFTSVSDNLKWLIEQKKVVKVFCYYGVPAKRADGSRYLIVKGQGLPNDIAELE